MLFKKISRSTAETVFIVVKNVSGSTAAAGDGVVFDVGASVDGVRVTQASATDLSAFAGVMDSAVADGAYGLAQAYGYRASVNVYNSSTASFAGGTVLGTFAAQWGLQPATTGTTTGGFGFLCEVVASSAGAYTTFAKGFIRAL